MRAKTILGRVAVIGVAGALLAGCATPQQTNTAVATGAGAAVGAGIGALIGQGKGAAIGAGIGAVAGGLVGYNWKAVRDDVQQSAQQSGAASLGVDVVEMPDGTLKVNLPGNASFDTDKYVLKPVMLPVLDSVARALAQHPELRTKVVGHTDSTGALAHNQTLSVNRARAVTDYLGQKGVAQNRMNVEGRGPNDAIGDNNTPEGRALNRRVEVYLYAVKQ